MSDGRRVKTLAGVLVTGKRRTTATTAIDVSVLEHFCQGASSRGAAVSEDGRVAVREMVAGQTIDRRWWRVAGPRRLLLVRLAGRLAAGYAAGEKCGAITASHARQALTEAGITGEGLGQRRKRQNRVLFTQSTPVVHAIHDD